MGDGVSELVRKEGSEWVSEGGREGVCEGRRVSGGWSEWAGW